MRLAASGYRQRRKYGKPETRAVEPFDPGRQHIAVKAQRQNGKSGGGHRWTAEERHGNPVIHLLVSQQGQMRATTQRRDRAPRGDRAFWDQLGPLAAKPRDHAVQQWIVAGAVNLGDRDPVLDAGKHCDLPIGNMAGEHDYAPASLDRPIHMFEAVRLYPPTRFEDAYFP